MQAMKYTIIWSLVLILALLVIYSSKARIYPNDNANPIYSEGLISQNKDFLKNPSAENTLIIIDNSYKILSAAPLNTDALQHLAELKYAKDNSARVTDIARAIKVRDARKASNLYTLVIKTLSINKTDEALDNLILLMQLDPEKSENYDVVLDLLFDTPEGRKAIEDRFDTAPAWARRLLIKRIASADKIALDNLNGNIRDFSEHMRLNGFGNFTFIEAYITRYTKLGFILEAREFWENAYGMVGVYNGIDGRVFNSDFQKLEVAAPFNWKFYSWENTNSELLENGGLYMYFNGIKETFIGRQFIFLDPEREYIAKYSAEYRYQKLGRYFQIQAVCMKTGDVILTIPFNSDVPINNNASVTLSQLPEECEAVDIQILGMTGDLQTRAVMNLKAFNIYPVEDAQ